MEQEFLEELEKLQVYIGDIAFVLVTFFSAFIFGTVGVKIRNWDRDFWHCFIYGWAIGGIGAAVGYGARLLFPSYAVGCVLLALVVSLSGEVWLAFSNQLNKTVLTKAVRDKLGALVGVTDDDRDETELGNSIRPADNPDRVDPNDQLSDGADRSGRTGEN